MKIQSYKRKMDLDSGQYVPRQSLQQIISFFLGLTILTILYKRYAGKRVRFADRVWQPFLCRFILINDYIHFVILTKKSKLHFLQSYAFFSAKIYLYTLSLKNMYTNGHCNLELKIGTTNVCKYPILILESPSINVFIDLYCLDFLNLQLFCKNCMK